MGRRLGGGAGVRRVGPGSQFPLVTTGATWQGSCSQEGQGRGVLLSLISQTTGYLHKPSSASQLKCSGVWCLRVSGWLVPLPGLLSHSPPWFSQSREMAGFGEGGAGLWRGWGLVPPHATAPFLVCPNSFPPSLLGPKPSLPWILEACRECPLGDTHGRLEQVRPQPSSRSAGRMRTQQPFADQLLGLKHYLAFFLLPVGCFPGHTCSDGTQSERTASPSWLLGQTSCGRAGVLPALVPQPRGEAANHIRFSQDLHGTHQPPCLQSRLLQVGWGGAEAGSPSPITLPRPPQDSW